MSPAAGRSFPVLAAAALSGLATVCALGDSPPGSTVAGSQFLKVLLILAAVVVLASLV
jgi:hypothetical protein